MAGLENIHQLLSEMAPVMGPQEYIFATFPGANYADLASLSPVASFLEDEGLSLVIERSVAENAQIPFNSVFKKISLQVHSSLDAVGLTAAISSVLAKQGISANIIAAFYHDHVFVPSARAQEALDILKGLS
ncbi:MAG: hypothetical protein ACI9H8_000014 [Lysobacterales bacterium]|jgi:hypothetical protein